MSKQEIISGLKNAIARGESIQKASQSFINAGYNPAEVQQAASEINIGIASKIPSPSQSQQQNNSNVPTPTPIPSSTITDNSNIKKPGFFSKIKSLFKENVVDYREEGKNKTYFLKKNPETKAYTFMTEHYKLIKVLEKYPSLRGIIEKIQKDKNIKLAILFGSYAKHKAKKESDIDIYIETKNRKIKEDLERIDSELSVKIGDYDTKNLLIKEIEKNHIVIKGVETYYQKNKFFD